MAMSFFPSISGTRVELDSFPRGVRPVCSGDFNKCKAVCLFVCLFVCLSVTHSVRYSISRLTRSPVTPFLVNQSVSQSVSHLAKTVVSLTAGQLLSLSSWLVRQSSTNNVARYLLVKMFNTQIANRNAVFPMCY